MLRLENIHFAYKSKPIFQGFSLEVHAGEVVRIEGGNGAGKSTLLALIAGLLQPQRGAIHLESEDPVLEYLPAEHNGLLQSQNIDFNLKFWRSLSGGQPQDAHIQSVREKWGIASNPFIDNLPIEKFSTGMKRRLALARTEYSQRPFWLLDEPTFGLDVEGQAQLRETIAAHCKHGGAVVLVTHSNDWLDGLTMRTVKL